MTIVNSCPPTESQTPMIRYLQCLLVSIAAALALPAAATTHSTDYTDLWYLPAESGWGINIIQQYDTVFATMFVVVSVMFVL